MSDIRIKLFAFDSAKITEKQMEDEINNFLSGKDIIVDPVDIEFIPAETSTFKIVYKLRKSGQKTKK